MALGRFWQKKMGSLRRAIDRLSYIGRASGTLVYIGANRGHGLRRIAHRYAQVFAFEPNPVCFAELEKRFRFKRNVTLINAACSTEEGCTTLFVSNNQGIASSLSPLRSDNVWHDDNGLAVERAIEVRTINVSDYLFRQNVTYIDMYVSDIQEYDLQVLETMKVWIDKKIIKNIQIELSLTGTKSQYINAPNNSIDKAKEILMKNYFMIASGTGTLELNKFIKNDEFFSYDTLWQSR